MTLLHRARYCLSKVPFASSTLNIYAEAYAVSPPACATSRLEDERLDPQSEINCLGRGQPPETALSPSRKHFPTHPILPAKEAVNA